MAKGPHTRDLTLLQESSDETVDTQMAPPFFLASNEQWEKECFLAQEN